MAGALLDRLTHHVHILEIVADSYRLKSSLERGKEKPDYALPDRSPSRASLEDLVDSATVDAIVCGLGGPHLGASPGPLSDAFLHFEMSMGKKPGDQEEFDEWAYLAGKGLMNGHIDWDILYECTCDAMLRGGESR